MNINQLDLLSLIREIVDVHDANEWCDVTGSYPSGEFQHRAECGELGEVIDRCRAVLGES